MLRKRNVSARVLTREEMASIWREYNSEGHEGIEGQQNHKL
jgi:hypothetical protein